MKSYSFPRSFIVNWQVGITGTSGLKSGFAAEMTIFIGSLKNPDLVQTSFLLSFAFIYCSLQQLHSSDGGKSAVWTVRMNICEDIDRMVWLRH